MCRIDRWCLTICMLFIFLESIGGYSLETLVKEKEKSRAGRKGGGVKGGGGKEGGGGKKGVKGEGRVKGGGSKKEVGGKGDGGKEGGEKEDGVKESGGKPKEQGETNINVDVNINVEVPVEIHKNPEEPETWAFKIMKGKVIDASKLKDEPGFDFSEAEMKKLKLWPAGVIPYFIDDFSFDKVLSDRIRTFLEVTNSITGLNFLELYSAPEDEKTRWVLFINRQGLLGCADHSHKNLTTEGVQKIVLGYDCLSTGGELAEAILALVGIPAQHNAPNRSKYITVVRENILPGKVSLFEVVQNNEWLFHDVDYDFVSASHYPLHKFTVNGKATIKPLREVNVGIGEGTGFSLTDIWKIRMLYNYISKKSSKILNLSKCNKLFKIGSNFSNYDPQSDNKEIEIKPRKKPNKYLGLLDVTEKNKPKTESTEKKIAEEANNNDKLKKRTHEGKLSSNADPALLVLSDFNTEEEFQNRQNQERIFTRPRG